MYIHFRHYGREVEFTWDERKNRLNKKKHRISFEMASQVFDDPYAVSVEDRG